MEGLMTRSLFDTGSALFEFDRKEVMERVSSFKERHGVETAADVKEFVFSQTEETTIIPPEMTNFRVIALELLGDGLGKVTCKACNRTYDAKELKRIKVGHGETPFSVPLERRGWIKRLFRRKMKLPGMLGGKGFTCPQNHEVISLIDLPPKNWSRFCDSFLG
jgi:hypothetical protein